MTTITPEQAKAALEEYDHITHPDTFSSVGEIGEWVCSHGPAIRAALQSAARPEPMNFEIPWQVELRGFSPTSGRQLAAVLDGWARVVCENITKEDAEMLAKCVNNCNARTVKAATQTEPQGEREVGVIDDEPMPIDIALDLLTREELLGAIRNTLSSPEEPLKALLMRSFRLRNS